MLIVCTGNICRSPFAEAYATSLWGAAVDVSSAGISAVTGMRATMLMRHVAKEHSLSLRHHRARALGECNTPDLVLALEPHHATVARHAFPELPAETVRLLGEAPIADPYGRRPIDYRTCADQIVSAIDALEI